MRTCLHGVYNSEIDEVEPCGNPIEGNSSRCASHNAFYRRLEKQNKKAEEKKALLLERQKEKRLIIKVDITKATYKLARTKKAIRKVSKKREELNKEYKALADEFKRTNPSCIVRINEYCTGKTESVHHKRGRGRYFLDVSTFLPCCLSCHSYLEAHPKEAIEKGWSESRLAKHEPHKDMKLIKKELKPNEYQCSECGEVYETGWTEEEAREEALKNFRKDDVSNMAVVCDDCYNEIIKQ